MVKIENFRENVYGVRGVFLFRNEEMVEKDIDIDFDIRNLLIGISYLTDMIREKKGDIRKLSIKGNDQLFLFFRNQYMLGIIAQKNVNEPLLEVMATIFLKQAHIKGDRRMRITQQTHSVIPLNPHEPELPITLAKEIICFTRGSEDILSSIPEYAREVLSLVDGTRTVRDVIELSGRPPEVVLDVLLTSLNHCLISFKKEE